MGYPLDLPEGVSQARQLLSCGIFRGWFTQQGALEAGSSWTTMCLACLALGIAHRRRYRLSWGWRRVQVAVDIGANEVGAIATVALLEETDQLLGKNHLFKRSLLLIKVNVAPDEMKLLRSRMAVEFHTVLSYADRTVTWPL